LSAVLQSRRKESNQFFDALPWEETEKRMEDLPLHSAIGEMGRSLFDKDNQMPLQKNIVTVNLGNPISKKKELISSARIWTPAATNLTSNAIRWKMCGKVSMSSATMLKGTTTTTKGKSCSR
jgi:hypothetical protein